MEFINSLKRIWQRTRDRLNETSLDSPLWLVNIVPSLAGFSIRKEKILAPFWIVHLTILFYVYLLGSLHYQVYQAQGSNEFIKSYVNVSLYIVLVSSSHWFIAKRPLLLSVLRKVKESDDLAKENVSLCETYEKLIGKIKVILFIFYGSNLTTAAFIYLPHRVDVNHDFAMTPCVGLEPLTSSPNREVCLTVLCATEFSIMTVALNYQALLLLLISHTTAMYTMMSEEIMLFNSKDSDVKEKLPTIIYRHVLTLEVIHMLKNLYSMPIGINFATNAACMSFFFYLPLSECLGFFPILVYCFLVFFLYCLLCQKLVNASEVFETSIYSCGWEKFDVKEKKTVYVMLLQAQKKIDILAADIVPVNIYTFATTLQAMFKFVTVVKF